MFIRFQSAAPNRHGRFPGVFALVNGLLWQGSLGSELEQWVRETNAYFDAAHTDPSTVIPDCYDPAGNPGAQSWFRAEAVELLGRTADYLDLLDRHDVPWVELRTKSPGRIVYQDEFQVVAVPLAHEEGWALQYRRTKAG